MIQIFVKVDGSKRDPDGEKSDGRHSRGCDETDPERRGRVRDNAWESAEKK